MMVPSSLLLLNCGGSELTMTGGRSLIGVHWFVVVNPEVAGGRVLPEITVIDGFAVVIDGGLVSGVWGRENDDRSTATCGSFACCTDAAAAGGFEVGEEKPVTAYFLENWQQGAGDVHVEVTLFAEGDFRRSNAGVPFGAVGAVDSVFAVRSTDALVAGIAFGPGFPRTRPALMIVPSVSSIRRSAAGANEGGRDGNRVVHQLLAAPGA